MAGAELVRQHEIAINNVLLGASTFISLALPPGWEIVMGAGSPEVTASHRHNGRRWVATGDAWYILHHPGRRWAMELRLTASLPPRSRRETILPELTVAGHPASVTWKQRKRGFIKRWPVTYVTVEFFCPHTKRQLRLEFSGSPLPEAFEEVLAVIKYARCH
ncbi:MAG: hypothetical protein JW953_13125 [Anaerolineae bacterium]|nr:hypothetical protein [Anaerolineae bacterium]